MRILIVGEPRWYAPELAEEVVNRLIARYGPSIRIVHGGGKGIERAFADACSDLGVEQERHPARWRELNHAKAVLRHDRRNVYYNANAASIRDAEMVESGADVCLVVHRDVRLGKSARDRAMLAIKAGIPTYLIETDEAIPRRIRLSDLI
jgi:hypothetical protein